MKTRWLGWCAVYILWLGACTSGPTAPSSTVTPTALVPAPSQTPVPVTRTPSTEPMPLEQTNATFHVQPLTALSYFGTVPAPLDRAVVVYTDAAGRVLSEQEVPANDGTIAFTIMTGGALGPATITIRSGAQVVAGPTIVHSVVADSTLQTDVPVYSDLFTQTTSFLGQSARAYELNGTTVRGYRSPDNPLFWLRDHVYQGRGFRYIEQDVQSLLTAFAEAQLPDGSLPDWIDAPALGVKAGRKAVEADVEFLFVQGIYEAWQMSGDDAWMTQMLPHARAALTYTTSDAVRWDATRGLIRRPYTIDMWDFSYGPTTNNPDTGRGEGPGMRARGVPRGRGPRTTSTDSSSDTIMSLMVVCSPAISPCRPSCRSASLLTRERYTASISAATRDRNTARSSASTPIASQSWLSWRTASFAMSMAG